MRDAGAVRRLVRARLRGRSSAPPAEVPAREQGFMLATLAQRRARGPDWLFEIKYDGVRVLAERRRRCGLAARPERPGDDRPLSGDRLGPPRARLRPLPDGRRDRGARCARRAELPAAAGPHGPHPIRDDVARAMARGARRARCSSTASPSRATISGACRSPARKACLQRAPAAARGRRASATTSEELGPGLPRGGRGSAARGHRGQAPRERSTSRDAPTPGSRSSASAGRSS